mmetsp:Transcript_45804/g.67605  ORF Transcript_45804/g.67605 Transcript_45804/m.67605 type:complete len:421 (+) Transcript_45804:213-1475(+)|eukprot:CAMPEP_0195539062 /NCGR_PEP_ID=MMETSP0794_2-20130614/49860_1 /TAXON_ID=515487 /ORGANISM="Stephanopyxis turris, Strain CCMP 815" /LENGTH=420 /DNA_ID=CAMNT_0040673079 /DNA_START=591 /DNA_END=1853 /DNA_ORIENTATION=+
MNLMLNHVDSPYIRTVGFLYLRYACDPNLLWNWFEPYLYDQEPVTIKNNGRKDSTIGDYVRMLCEEMNYHGTVLPRLPVGIERDIKVKLLMAEKIEERALQHLTPQDNARPAVEYFNEGCRVRALYGDEENPITWYDSIIEKVIRRDEETGDELERFKYHVTFPEYGNSEIVSLGELDLLPHGNNTNNYGNGQEDNAHETGRYRDDRRKRDYQTRDYGRHGWDSGDHRGEHDRDRPYSSSSWSDFGDSRGGGRGYERNDRGYRINDSKQPNHRGVIYDRNDHGRKRSRSATHDLEPCVRSVKSPNKAAEQEGDLMEEVLRREREKSAAKGKAYAVRPPTFKKSLAAKQDPSSATTVDSVGRRPNRDRDVGRRWGVDRAGGRGNEGKNASSVSEESQVREKSVEERAAIEEKRRKLKDRYG